MSDLDLDPVTLIKLEKIFIKIDLDMVKMYYYTKNEVSMSRHSKVIAQTDTHTHTHSMKPLPSHIHSGKYTCLNIYYVGTVNGLTSITQLGVLKM